MKVALLERMRTICIEMTKNDPPKSQDKDVQNEVKNIMAQQTINLSKLAIEVSNNQAIPKENSKGNRSFVPQGIVDEQKADQQARDKKGKTQEIEQDEIEK